jgi:DNA replication protein DnaC
LRTNQACSFGPWNEIIGDPVIAKAILDRILHHSTTINIKGNSYRLRENVKAGLIREPEAEQN